MKDKNHATSTRSRRSSRADLRGMPLRFILSVCAMAILAGSAVLAQETTGLVSGTVLDSTGAVVPGAKLVAETPTLPRPLETVSDDHGRYAFPQMPVGLYTITVTKAGFAKLVQRNMQVKLGSQITFNPELAVGQVTEIVEVSANAIALDVSSSRTNTNIAASTFDSLPKGRNFHSVLAIAPGVRQEVKSGNAGVGGFQVDGASGIENNYLIDGVDVSDVRRSSLRIQNSIPFEFVSEVQIKSSGFEAEFGGATGGVISVVTKGGSNEFHGAGVYQFTTDELNPRPRGNWKRSPASADVADFFAPKKDNWGDRYPGFSFTGPILKNMLYFSAGYYPQMYQTERINNYASGARTFNRDDILHYSLARLDYSPTSKLQVNSSWIWTPWKQTGNLPDPDPRIAAPSNDQSILGGYQPAQTFTANANYTVTSKFLISARYGYKYQNDKLGNYGLPSDPFITYVTSAAGIAGVPADLQRANGYTNISSNLQTLKDITTRNNMYLDGSYIASIGGQQHYFKVGYMLNRLANDVDRSYPTGRFRIFWNDAFSRGNITNQRGPFGYYIWEDGVNNQGSVNSRNQGIYFQDSWRVHKRVTLNLGVRFENEFLPPFKAEVNGRKVANPVSFGWGDKVAPRIGGAWDVFGDGKTKISGSFGIFYDVLKYELARGSFGSDYWWSHVFTLDTPGNLLGLSKANPNAASSRKITQYDNRTLPIDDQGNIEGIDPGIKPVTSREFTLTVSREITPNLVFSGRYVRKDLLKMIEDIGVLDEDYNEVYLTGNPGFGLTRDPKSVYGQKTPNGQEWLVPQAIRQYDAVELRLDGRYSRLFGMLSYTWSRLYGNSSGQANSDESGRSDPGVSRAFDLPYYYFDASGSQTNVFGRLGTDRPHTLKLFGSYDLNSKIGKTTFGLQQFAWSGTPDSTSVIYISAPTFPFGRGDLGRTPNLWQTDLSIAHQIRATERVGIRLEANFQNIFNQNAIISRVTQYNRAGAISDTALPLAQFFQGYDVKRFVAPGNPPGTVAAYNPIYGLPAGDYRNGDRGPSIDPFQRGYGPTGYQAPREIRLGLRVTF